MSGVPHPRTNRNNTSIAMSGAYQPRLQRREGMLRENLETSYPGSRQRFWPGFETYFRAGIWVSGFLDDIV
jgi:hypothetical protein